MKQPFWRQQMPAIVIGLLDVFSIGLGMGVPVFAVLLGFPVGWWVAVRQLRAAATQDDTPPGAALRSLLGWAAALSVATFVVLAVLWGPQVPKAFDPSLSASEWGIPLILYGSTASKIGWLVLMLVISPALQFMAVATAGAIRLSRPPR